MSSEIETQEKINFQKGKTLERLILLITLSSPLLLLLINLPSFSTTPSFLPTLSLSLLFSLLGFLFTYLMIPNFFQMNIKGGYTGVDINKVEDPSNKSDPSRKIIPESLGIVPATIFIVISILTQTFLSLSTQQQLEYNASLLSICFMIFLGFADDSLDLRWRYKLVLPLTASIPLLIAYGGSTSVLLPKFVSRIIGFNIIELGIVYKIYMSMLAIFCTNSINIYAGINGLEVGQSVIIAASILVYNVIEITKGKIEENVFSITIVLPFLMCSLALFLYNKFPSQCFVGDTYCYFAGMCFACAGILGHFSKTILLFFIPQIINFVYSLPQLLGIVPIDRHRLPKFSKATMKLTGQKRHWNLLNAALIIVGPSREQDICNYLLLFQIVCSVVGIVSRYTIFAFE